MEEVWLVYLDCIFIWRKCGWSIWTVSSHEEDVAGLPGLYLHMEEVWLVYLDCIFT
jgi:hypothetical protein